MGCNNAKGQANSSRANNNAKLKLSGQDKVNEYEVKICLLGDVNVGKTSIASRFCKNSFNEN